MKDDLEVLKGIPSIQTADIADNPRFTALLAAMLRNNDQLFSLYVGYDDGSFIELDAIEGVFRHGIRALTQVWCSSDYSAPISLA